MIHTAIAFDPGKTVGYAYQSKTIPPRIKRCIWTGQCSPQEVSSILQINTPTTIIYEQFLKRSVAVRVDPIALQVIGVIEDYAVRNGIKAVQQTPGHGKFFWTNDKLKKIGLYEKGKPHAMDALRHLLYELSKHDRHYIRLLIGDS